MRMAYPRGPVLAALLLALCLIGTPAGAAVASVSSPVQLPLPDAHDAVILQAADDAAAPEERLPDAVAEYFASGLVPRLTELYAPGADAASGIAFDETTEVGAVTRLRAWTAPFLEGTVTLSPVRLVNDWVAPVSVAGVPVGLATVWINPGLSAPELADFMPEPALVEAVAAAPEGSLLVRDAARGAWFALADGVLVPLVAGHSGVEKSMALTAAQAIIVQDERRSAAAPDTGGSQGVLVAALVLGIVILLLVGFVLLPVRRRVPDAEAS
ncbi:hypothetical protein FB562_1944 [Homoserinimonas aerilata]|uniref:LPXTG-motif cell wall-anchored protein n=2 Tax=Homoserinimonas aerilata TaxID=1162970 RepID=A0A542YL97_9MICO|nr:hypothetical protein FB562_1944 [Homoserinimonas aerilata]